LCPHTLAAARECAGIRNLGEKAGVQLTELLCDGGGTADSHTNLHGNILVYDDIAEIDDIAEVEEPLMPMMPMMPVMPSTHAIELRIDQFTHSTHDFPPRELQ
jgi:hypothetical protein